MKFVNQFHNNNLFYMLEKGCIDATIWSGEDIKNFDGTILNLPERMTELVEDVGKAAIVVTKKILKKWKLLNPCLIFLKLKVFKRV